MESPTTQAVLDPPDAQGGQATSRCTRCRRPAPAGLTMIRETPLWAICLDCCEALEAWHDDPQPGVREAVPSSSA